MQRPPCQLHSSEEECQVAFGVRRPLDDEARKCPWMLMKTSIISARRGINPTYKSVTPEAARTAFSHMADLFEGNVEYWCAKLNTRWLVSVCDSYADFGQVGEAECALQISLLVNWERMAWSARNGCTKATPHTRGPAWDGTSTLGTDGRVDVHRNLLRRLRKQWRAHPYLDRLGCTILLRMTDEPRSTPCLLNASMATKFTHEMRAIASAPPGPWADTHVPVNHRMLRSG